MTIQTSLFEKLLNLYLYLPPQSAHPPGALTALVYGMICRVYRLTSDPANCQAYLQTFYTHLRCRGHSKHALLPLFNKAGLVNRAKPHRKKMDQSNSNMLFLHIPFHPANPSSCLLQDTYQDLLAFPKAATPLSQISNTHFGVNCGVRKMIIAYHRPPNLVNLLCPHKFERTPGPPVSAFM
jgi:hypothetical protein